jgi:hypothetical protein
MIEVHHRVGRLIELETTPPVSRPTLVEYRSKLEAAYEAIGEPAIVVSDLRTAPILPQHIADTFIQHMKADRARILRSALLYGSRATSALQVERMVLEANNPHRAAFNEIEPLLAFIAEVATPEELASAERFLRARNG